MAAREVEHASHRPISRRDLLGSLRRERRSSRLVRNRRRRKAPFSRARFPSSGEALPLVGLGSWITFNVGNDLQGARLLRRR
jgi:hypothetical protein